MRTSIFTEFANLSNEFRDDFKVLWEIPEKDRAELVRYVSELSRAETKGQAEKLMDRAVTEIGGNSANLLRAVRLLNFISEEWNPVLDTPENFLRDLAELEFVPPSRAEEAKDFLLDFLTEIQKDNARRLEKMHARSLLPHYAGTTTMVDLRAVFRNPFGVGLEDRIEDYQPAILSFVPVVIVRVRRSSGDPETFEFQCEKDQLRRLIDSLEAAVKDLETATSSLPSGEREGSKE